MNLVDIFFYNIILYLNICLFYVNYILVVIVKLCNMYLLLLIKINVKYAECKLIRKFIFLSVTEFGIPLLFSFFLLFTSLFHLHIALIGLNI